jgi:hypothetical protein
MRLISTSRDKTIIRCPDTLVIMQPILTSDFFRLYMGRKLSSYIADLSANWQSRQSAPVEGLALPAIGGGLARSVSQGVLGSLILIMAAFILFFHLGQGSLNDWDEATYAEVAREMIARSDWITPYWNGVPFNDKPPLVMWLMAAGMKITSSMELATRYPSALAGFFVIILTALLGRVLFCTWTGLTAAVLLLLSSESWDVNFVLLARQGMLDAPLTACTLWAFLHFYAGIRRPQHWLLMGIPIGLAVMTKSFLVLPTTIAFFVFVLMLAAQGYRFASPHWRYAAGGVAVALAISLPWHLIQISMHGQEFLDGYVVRHFMKTQQVESGNSGGRTFYLRAIGEAFPYLAWSIIPAVCFAIWRAFRFHDSRALLLLTWIAVPLLLFSSIPTKLPWYILPIFPALVLVIAFFFRAAIPRHWVPETIFLVTLIGMVALWNIRTLRPVDASSDVKTLGNCIVRITPIDEQIANYDPSDFRPSILVYGKGPIIHLGDLEKLNWWIEEGGHFLWVEEPYLKQISALPFKEIAQFGSQHYLRREDGSNFLADCTSSDLQ